MTKRRVWQPVLSPNGDAVRAGAALLLQSGSRFAWTIDAPLPPGPRFQRGDQLTLRDGSVVKVSLQAGDHFGYLYRVKRADGRIDWLDETALLAAVVPQAA